MKILDTKKENGLSVHLVAEADFKAFVGQCPIGGTVFHAVVDGAKRQATACNHTATHLMHHALRAVLGEHVEQKGSSVNAARLRFDFSHFTRLSPEEIREVERRVNAMVRQCIPLEEHRSMPIDEARGLGAMALFGEKYGDRVRVVKYGPSVEFCGGTHVANTGMIGLFRIVSEGAVAAGMRRIEAVTATAAEQLAYDHQQTLDTIREAFKNTKDITGSIAKLQEENASLRTALDALKRQQAEAFCASLAERLQAGEHTLVLRTTEDLSAMRDALMPLRNAMPDLGLVLGSDHGGKPMLLVLLGQERVDAGMNAGQMVRELCKPIMGGGGGQPFFATGSGKSLDGLDQAISMAKEIISGR